MTTPRHFEFSANWPEQSDDVAEVSIRLGRQVLSRIADTQKQSLRDYFRASATSLALWLADNWWRLRWETLNDSRFASTEWRLRHELTSAAGGTLWPPLMIYSSGNRIVFAPSFGKYAVLGPQTYLDFNVTTVTADEYEAELDHFFEAVVQHCAKSVDGGALEVILRQIRAERSDPELAGWRRLEACLGYDPDEAPEAVINALVGLESVVGEAGVEEAAHAKPGPESAAVLKNAIEAVRTSNARVNLDLATKIKRDPTLPPTASPWQFAESAAMNLRRIIGAQTGPLKGDIFAGIFRARWAQLKEVTGTARHLPYGARLMNDAGDACLALNTRSAHDRHFELARVFGDAVWQSGSTFGIVSRAKTDRQKFQRAFAHNLLCPFDDLRRELDISDPTQESINAVARKFHVHSSVVRSQLAYKGYLPFENVGEEAEAA